MTLVVCIRDRMGLMLCRMLGVIVRQIIRMFLLRMSFSICQLVITLAILV